MGTFIKKTFVLLSLTLAFVVNGYFLWAAQPDWWADYSLIDNSVRQDDAIATVGQAKHVVQKAYQYLEVKLASVGGAGAEVTALYNSYCANAPANPNADLQLLTIGQLKYLAKPFYDRLNSNEVSLDTSTMNPASVDIYPWTSDQMDDADLAFATLGQVKYTFSFDLSSWTAPNPVYTVNFNLDGKGVRTGGGKLVQTIVEGNSATEPAVTGNEGWLFVGWDMAFDNVTSNLTVTAQYGQDTDDDGILDEEELANGLDPLLDDAMKDKDGDGYPNVYELRRGEAGSVNNNELVPRATYVVSTDDPNASHTTIQAAIDAATADYSIIRVDPSTTPYTGSGNPNFVIDSDDPSILLIANDSDSATVLGDGSEAILDGAGTLTGPAVRNDKSAIVGFTVRNCLVNASTNHSSLHLDGGDSNLISRCKIHNSRNSSNAPFNAALYVDGASNTLIEYVSIFDNPGPGLDLSYTSNLNLNNVVMYKNNGSSDSTEIGVYFAIDATLDKRP